MEFSGPDVADFANVARLNHAFLVRLRHVAHGRRLRALMPAATGALAARLTDLQIERLSGAPFLLLSLREREEAFWRVLTHQDSNFDLFETAAPDRPPDPLATAALSFLWQLAARNPYAARLVSGATLAWCERLSECTLVDTLQRVACRDDCIEPRLAGDGVLWTRLLGPGLSSNDTVRSAAHLTALQVVLTADPMTGYRELRPAACGVAVPKLSVADTGERR